MEEEEEEEEDVLRKGGEEEGREEAFFQTHPDHDFRKKTILSGPAREPSPGGPVLAGEALRNG